MSHYVSLTMEELVRTLRTCKPIERKALISDCDAILSDAAVREDERVACSRILVGLLPFSLNVIERSLGHRESKQDYENHFTLFCFLDLRTIAFIGLSHFVKERILGLLSQYLHHVATKRAYAAWMCGDLLGDHWEGNVEALDVLLSAIQKASYVPGRLAALHGIEHWVDKGSYGESKTSKRVADTLFRVSNFDRSRKVRSGACAIIDRVISRERSARERLSILHDLGVFMAKNPLNSNFKACCLSIFQRRSTSDTSVQVRAYSKKMMHLSEDTRDRHRCRRG
jgi:hypothetical protein